MLKKIKNNKTKFFNILVFITFSIFILFIAFNHENYEDEAQSWLIARDLSPIGVIKQMAYEGHSPLWYFIIMPFAKLGFPVVSQNIISCLFAIATVYLILKKIDCNKLYKILFIFNGGMIFWYSVIARPYALIPFLLILISIYYKDRKKHPYIYSLLLALLCQTHLIMLPTACLLAAEYYGFGMFKEKNNDKKKLVRGFIIFSISLLVMCTIVLIAKNTCKITDVHINANKIKNMSELNFKIKSTMNNSMKILYGDKKVSGLFYNLVCISISFILIGSFKNLKQAIFFWSQFLFVFLLHSFFWFEIPPRVYIIIITMMFWVINYKYDLKKYENNTLLELGVIMFMILSSIGTYKLAYQDIKENYSTGKITAEYIKKNISKDSIFICTDTELSQSINIYLKKNDYKFYMPNTQKYITYVIFDEKWSKGISSDDVDKAIKKLSHKNIYLLSQIEQQTANLKLLYSSTDKMMKSYYPRYEQYKIYKIKKDVKAATNKHD
ncbi:MAG: hypothetical protein E7158_05715 [Firmicutes bacterium]|nr:hypothetical protein [Bacillota bacterium]